MCDIRDPRSPVCISAFMASTQGLYGGHLRILVPRAWHLVFFFDNELLNENNSERLIHLRLCRCNLLQLSLIDVSERLFY
jgi:DTW domain-containing protein YfiP